MSLPVVLNAKEAVGAVDKEAWVKTTVAQRLELLYKVRANMIEYEDELAQAVAEGRNKLIGEQGPSYSNSFVLMGCMVAPATNIKTCIDLYESLKKTDKPLQPNSVTKVAEGIYDVYTFPKTYLESFLYPTQKMFVRVKSEEEPAIKNPMDKPSGIVGILGAGNTGSAVEIFKSLFFDNRVVVYKSHPLNVESDKVWIKILQPLVDQKAVSFCKTEDGQALSRDPRVTHVYFTGSTSTARVIQKSTKTPVIAECGGVNPVIVVPGDKPWTPAEMEHQAVQIATVGKHLGGAVCARPQMLVTSKNWPQRQEFLDAMVRAMKELTPAIASFYPGADKTFAKFQARYPNATLIEPENGKHGEKSRCLWIPGLTEEDTYACRNEAFSLILCEIPLDTEPNADSFLPAAVSFCNEKLFGSLACSLLIDGPTQKAHTPALDQAITDLKYGAISVNNTPAVIWAMPHLIWGGCGEESKPEIETGIGHFGNPFGYENVEKSIVFDQFVTPSQLLQRNNAVLDSTLVGLVKINLQPTWYNSIKFVFYAILGSFKSKDF